MASLKRDQSIRVTISWRPSGVLLVTTALISTTPKLGERLLDTLPPHFIADLGYPSSPHYAAKRFRNAALGALLDPTLE